LNSKNSLNRAHQPDGWKIPYSKTLEKIKSTGINVLMAFPENYDGLSPSAAPLSAVFSFLFAS